MNVRGDFFYKHTRIMISGFVVLLALVFSLGVHRSIAFAGLVPLGDACSTDSDCVQNAGCNPSTGRCQSTGFYLNTPCDPNVSNVCGSQAACVGVDGSIGQYVCGGEGPTVTITAQNPNDSKSGGVTFAQFVGSGHTGIIGVLNDFVIPTIFALAFAVFLFGVLKYFFLEAGSEDGRKKGRQFVIWGLIGMVVMLSVWGLVAILLSTLGFS